MSLAFGIGAHGPIIGISTPLLDEKKEPTRIINNIYVPLTEEQADLYMQRSVYKEYLEQKIKTIYFYRDKNKHLQPMFYKDIKTRKIERFTHPVISKRRKVREATMREEDKTILLTEGIGGLKEAEGIWEEESDAMKTCGTVGIFVLAVIIPCLMPWVCYNEVCGGGKEKGELKDVPDIQLKVKDKNTGEIKFRNAKACMGQSISVD